MAERDEIPKTDPSDIEALVQRLKHSNIEPRRSIRIYLTFDATQSRRRQTPNGANIRQQVFSREPFSRQSKGPGWREV